MSMLSPGGKVPKKRRPSNGSPSGVGRRVLEVIVALVLLASAGTAAWWFGVRTPPAGDAVACRAAATTAAPTPPAIGPARVTVNVFNATERRGLATIVATQLRARRFTVAKVGNDPLGRKVAGTVEVRSGPRGRASAAAVASHVKGAVLVPDRRKDATVDLVIGVTYTALRNPAQVRAAVSAAGRPAPVRSAPAAPATNRPEGCA